MKMTNLVKNNQSTMKYKILVLAILFYACSFAQVGINTSELYVVKINETPLSKN